MVSVRGFTPEPRSRSRSSGVTGGKPTTPRDTREQGAQYNRQTTALRPKQPEAAGRRRGMQLQCNVVWKCSSQTLALPHTVKVTPAFSVHHRDGETMVHTILVHSIPPTLPHSGHGVRYLAPPWWLPPTLSLSPPHANTEGSAVARRE